MTPAPRHSRRSASEILTLFRPFAKNEEGAVTIFACFMVIIMLMVCGIGVDMMRHEMERTRLQAVSDRAVLAAADLDQTLPPEAVVRDYFNKAGLADYVSSVSVSGGGVISRTVSVNASQVINTQFMDLLGVETLTVPARATANEFIPNTEISLVLDISGSMRFSNRMNDLRPAAQGFINDVLADNTTNSTSVNLIPYAGQTNPGPFMFNRLGGVRYDAIALDEADGGIPEAQSHGTLPVDDEGGEGTDPNTRYVFPNVSSCIDMEPGAFTGAELPAGALYDQTAHFMNWTIASNVMDWGWCPQDQTSIQYMSNDADALNTMIGNMRMHDGTGTHYAMKYAVALLDPSSRDDMTAAIGAGLASPDFIGRPADYGDTQTAKYIVLMTDGQITEQVRPEDTLDPENATVELNDGRRGEREQLTPASTNVASFFAQCDLAKNAHPRPIIVFTIAFEAPGTPEQQMRDCASSPSHFFSADGSTIADTFEAIAGQISQLKLTN